MARTRDIEAHERILDAVKELVGEYGPSAPTVTDIADRAGVGRQTIYRWWPTRSDLILETLQESFDSPVEFGEPGQLYFELRQHLHEVVSSLRGIEGLLIKDLIAQSQGDPDLARQLRSEFFAARRKRLTSAMKAAMERDELSSGADPAGVANALYGPLWSALLIGHEPLTPRTADRILDLVWIGIAP